MLILQLLTISACKDPDELGLEVLPSSDQLGTTFSDTTFLATRVVKEDSLRSDEVSRLLLGNYVDPVFGLVKGDLYTQVLLNSIPAFEDDSLYCDSVIISFAYTDGYGDISSSQALTSFQVYKLTEDMSADSAYYSNKTFLPDISLDLAAGYPLQIKPTDSSAVFSTSVDSTVMEPPQLRIKLNPLLGDSILHQYGQTTLANNDAWRAYFKGLYITSYPHPVSGQGAIGYFDPVSTYSRMILYYHKDGGDTLSYSFTFYAAARVNHFEHNFSGTDVGNQWSDSLINDDVNYIQSMAGTKVKISFPYLKHFTDSGSIAVNKADLAITVVPNTDDVYSTPNPLFLSTTDSTGTAIFVVDYYEGAGFFGGYYDATDGAYHFNISRHIQQILNGTTKDYGLYLTVSSGSVQASRVVVGSGKQGAAYRMKLNLYYTKL